MSVAPGGYYVMVYVTVLGRQYDRLNQLKLTTHGYRPILDHGNFFILDTRQKKQAFNSLGEGTKG